jgi:hypothetical protein
LNVVVALARPETSRAAAAAKDFNFMLFFPPRHRDDRPR